MVFGEPAVFDGAMEGAHGRENSRLGVFRVLGTLETEAALAYNCRSFFGRSLKLRMTAEDGSSGMRVRRLSDLAAYVFVAFAFTCGFSAGEVAADESGAEASGKLPAAVDREVDFVKDVQPILRTRCYTCHSRELDEAELRLDLKDAALNGSSTGKVILPGRSADSLLIQLVAGTDPDGRVMPPEDDGEALSREQIAILRAWIDQGAKWPADADLVVDVTSRGNDHWAYQPVQRPLLPEVSAAEWAGNPIDRFVRARQEAAGVEAPSAATPRELVRRVHLDLIGLPPDPVLVDACVAVPSSAHDERIVDALLAEPQYGERWARHWLDLVRYADTNGYEVDGEKPFAWRYRDYVVDAFNHDKPYDQFVIEQLAGDELESTDAEGFIATGYIRMGQWDAERGASVQKNEKIDERANELDDMVATTSQVFLGLTLGCARCHDHKFDALTARDYYSMAAIFNPLTRPRVGRSEKPRALGTREQLAAKAKADDQISSHYLRIDDLVFDLLVSWLDSDQTKLEKRIIDAWKEPRGERGERHQRVVRESRKDVYAELEKAVEAEGFRDKMTDAARAERVRLLADIEALRPIAELPQGYFLWEASPKAPPTHLLIRGSAQRPGEEVPAAVPAVLAPEQPEFLEPSAYTSRRRLTLARWLVRTDHPLTPRVIVNRIWQWHFGHGLVRTPSEFGVRGDEPSHPELLDWLARWFVNDAGWSLKKLNRLIAPSRTYRISKRFSEEAASVDPDNRLLWRFPYRRLELEAIRDSILAVSGQLNSKMSGPSTYPLFPEDAKRGSFHFGKQWKEFDESEASRRTLYAYIKRTMVHPLFEVLDFCDTSRSADRREITTVAPQALTLFNGEFVNRQARYLAARLKREVGDDKERQIVRAYRLALGRTPSDEELNDLQSFLKSEEATARDAEPDASDDQVAQRALAQMCRVMFNLNEFVYTD